MDRIGAEDSNARRVIFKPFIPAASPTIIVHINLVGPDLRDLRLQPLIDSVLDVEPHSDFVLPLAATELLDVREMLSLVGSTHLLPLTEPSILVHDSEVLRELSCLVVDLRLHQAVNISLSTGQSVQRLLLVEAGLLEIVPGILLEDKASIAPQYIRLVERAHNFLHQVDIAEALGKCWTFWLPVMITKLDYLPLLLILLRCVFRSRHQMNYLIVFDLK